MTDEEWLANYYRKLEGRRQARLSKSLEERKQLRASDRERLWENTYSNIICGCFGGPNSQELMEQELDELWGEDSK